MEAAQSFDLGELFRRIDRVRVESDQSWASVSRHAGVSASTIRDDSSAGRRGEVFQPFDRLVHALERHLTRASSSGAAADANVTISG